MNCFRSSFTMIATKAHLWLSPFNCQSIINEGNCHFRRLVHTFANRISTISLRSKNIHAKKALRRFESSSSSTSNVLATESSASTINTRNLLADSGLLQLPRHGQGDAVITLNVGGKEFITLRSTIASNEVLAEHVARAEANQEFTFKTTEAVFIDRDPTHFPIILNFLRNKVEGLSYNSKQAAAVTEACNNLKTATTTSAIGASMAKASAMKHVQLPTDLRALRDIYVEATHFRIPELEYEACKANFMVNVFQTLGGTNPFDMANNMLKGLRRGLVAMGSVGTIAIGSQQDLSSVMATLFPAWFSEANKKKEKRNDTHNDNHEYDTAATA